MFTKLQKSKSELALLSKFLLESPPACFSSFTALPKFFLSWNSLSVNKLPLATPLGFESKSGPEHRILRRGSKESSPIRADKSSAARYLGAGQAAARRAADRLRPDGDQPRLRLVLPASTKFLIDDIIGKRQTQLLVPLVSAVVAATVIQGITSFTLTQLLSKAAQTLIAELRRKVQAHIGRLPVTYYDANKSGTLVSRIMSDVEGIRNLIGTGLVEFVGGLLTAVIALVVLIRISALHDRLGGPGHRRFCRAC